MVWQLHSLLIRSSSLILRTKVCRHLFRKSHFKRHPNDPSSYPFLIWKDMLLEINFIFYSRYCMGLLLWLLEMPWHCWNVLFYCWNVSFSFTILLAYCWNIILQTWYCWNAMGLLLKCYGLLLKRLDISVLAYQFIDIATFAYWFCSWGLLLVLSYPSFAYLLFAHL